MLYFLELVNKTQGNVLKACVSFIGFFVLVLSWELAAHFSEHLLFVLPAPSDVLRTLIECHSRLLFHSLATLKEMVGGFALALTVAFPLAWTMMRFHTSRAILQPFFIVIQCLPMFTLAPIMVIWFGWSYTAIVVPTALMIFFPLTLNIYQGLRSTPSDLIDFFKANQATQWQTFFKLRLPWAVPHIFAGFRISSAIAGIGAVAGEWAGAQKGLGILMLESRRNTDLEITFSALVCLTLMSASLYGLVIFFEKISLPPRRWKWPKKASPSPARINVKKKHLALSFFLVGGTIFAFMFTSCHTQKQNSVRLLLDWLPNPNHVPLYVGLEKGFFKEEGISLIIHKMHESGGGVSHLTTGRADLLVSHLPSALRASARGAQIKIIGTLIKEPLNALIYLKKESVKKSSDLTGSVLGYCLGGPDTAFLDYLLKEGSIVPKEKRNVSVDLISAIGTKSVDFIYGGFWNIEPWQLRALGVETEYFKIQDFGVPNYYEMIILGLIESPYTEPSFVTHFQRALQKSIQFSLDNPDKAFAIYLHMNPDKRKKTATWEKEAWRVTCPLLAQDQSIDPNCIKECYSWFQERKLLKNTFDFQRLY